MEFVQILAVLVCEGMLLSFKQWCTGALGSGRVLHPWRLTVLVLPSNSSS